MAYDDSGNWVDDEQQQQYNVQNMGQNNTGVAGPQQNDPYGQQQQQQQAAPAPAPAPAAQPFNYDQFREGWLTAGFGNKTSPEQVAQHAAKWGVTIKNGDKAYDPQGNFIADLVGDVGGRSTLQFLRGPEGHATSAKYAGKPAPKGKGGPKSPPGPGNLPGGGGAGGGGGSTGGGFTVGGGDSGALFNLLMERARGSEAVDPNDPIIKAQVDAFRSEGNAARRDFLAQQAEAGGPYGNMRSEERRSAEQLGKSVGGFQGQAMQQELSARRAKIEHALDAGAAFLSDQQKMALQNELTRLQLAQQESQFGRSLAWDKSRFGQQLGWDKESFGRTMGQRAHEYDTSRWDSIFG